jgi:hypothetical protein
LKIQNPSSYLCGVSVATLVGLPLRNVLGAEFD